MDPDKEAQILALMRAGDWVDFQVMRDRERLAKASRRLRARVQPAATLGELVKQHMETSVQRHIREDEAYQARFRKQKQDILIKAVAGIDNTPFPMGATLEQISEACDLIQIRIARIKNSLGLHRGS
jgi:hypothetical protein